MIFEGAEEQLIRLQMDGDGGNILPNLVIFRNDVYVPGAGYGIEYDGVYKIDVQIPEPKLQADRIINENGTFVADEPGCIGMSSVVVNVEMPTYTTTPLNIPPTATQREYHAADYGADGFDPVNVGELIDKIKEQDDKIKEKDDIIDKLPPAIEDMVETGEGKIPGLPPDAVNTAIDAVIGDGRGGCGVTDEGNNTEYRAYCEQQADGTYRMVTEIWVNGKMERQSKSSGPGISNMYNVYITDAEIEKRQGYNQNRLNVYIHCEDKNGEVFSDHYLGAQMANSTYPITPNSNYTVTVIK